METEPTPEMVRNRMMRDGATRQNSPFLILVDAVIALENAIKAYREAERQYPDDWKLHNRLAKEWQCRLAEMRNAKEAAKDE